MGSLVKMVQLGLSEKGNERLVPMDCLERRGSRRASFQMGGRDSARLMLVLRGAEPPLNSELHYTAHARTN
jgi:hypothetical protein